MARTDAARYTQAIWSAAIREAAPVFSAYLTPLGYSVGSLAVRAIDGGSTDLSFEVGARLDLGRSARVAELLRALDSDFTVAYRHEVSISRGLIRGTPHIPRYLRMIARGDQRGVPVAIAQRQPTTPENLFVSEVVRLSRMVCSGWMLRDSEERVVATELADRFGRFESRMPWSNLRAHPRPALNELSAIVEGRIISGAASSRALSDLQRLFPTQQTHNPTAFEEATNALSLMASTDPRFEDRVFELIVLAWLFDAIRERATAISLDLRLLKGGGGLPVAVAEINGVSVQVFFQAGSTVLPAGQWKYRHSGAPLRAIPDIIVRIASPAGNERLIIVDAKNRGSSTESEVAYKLLGYRENLRLAPYSAFGIYPSLAARPRIRRLSDGSADVALIHVPLAGGKVTANRLIAAIAKGITFAP